MGRNKSRYIDKADKKKLKDKSTVVSTIGHDPGSRNIRKADYSSISAKDILSIANFSPTDPGNSDYEFVNGIVKSSGKDLKALVDLAEAGKLKCCVDEHFPFDKVPEALSKSLTARSGGKLIIDVA